MALGYAWTNIAGWSVAKGAATVNFWIDVKLNRQSIEENYSIVDTRLTSTITNNLAGSGYNFGLSGSSGISGTGVWTFRNETILTGQYRINHEPGGAATSFVTAHVYNGYWGINHDFSGSFTLPTIPRQANVTSGTNFTDETNPTINYTNPGNFRINARLEFNNQSIQRDNILNTGSYTFALTDEERNVLRRASANSNSLSVREVIGTCIGSTKETYWSWADRIMTIINANPTFNDFTYKDTNSVTTAVTNDDQVLIKGLSTLEVNISSDNKMVANKSATPKNYLTLIDNKNITTSYSDKDLTINVGAINTSGKQKLSIRAYDSRNNYKVVDKNITIYDYTQPIINAEASRLHNWENETTLKISGSFNLLTIDDTNKNEITSVEYRYQPNGGEWSEWTSVTPTITDSNFTCPDTILNLDNTKTYKIEARVIDKLSTGMASLDIDVGKPIFFISSNKKKCYVNNAEILTMSEMGEKTLSNGTVMNYIIFPSGKIVCYGITTDMNISKNSSNFVRIFPESLSSLYVPSESKQTMRDFTHECVVLVSGNTEAGDLVTYGRAVWGYKNILATKPNEADIYFEIGSYYTGSYESISQRLSYVIVIPHIPEELKY